jgi:hypothetical protein
MTASKFRLIAYALVLAGGCVSPGKYERVDVTMERIALRDAWLQTAVPFGVVLCLVLLLVVLYYRRNMPERLDALFKLRRAPDLVGVVRAWWRHREELAPFQNLLSIQRYRVRQEERATRRIRERVADVQAERAAREAIRAAEAARRAQPPLGPPTLGFFSRAAVGFGTGVLITVLLLLPLAGPDPSGFAPLFVVFGGGMGLLISLVGSLACAAFVSVAAEKSIWLAIICGVAGVVLGSILMPSIWLVMPPPIVLLGGAAIGLAIGLADESSRRPEPIASASRSVEGS